jgi:hypothetical protein
MGKRAVGGGVGMGPHRSWSATSVATRCLTLVIGALEMGVALGQCGNGMNGMSFANLHNTFYYSQVSTLAQQAQLDKVHKGRSKAWFASSNLAYCPFDTLTPCTCRTMPRGLPTRSPHGLVVRLDQHVNVRVASRDCW